MRTQGEGGRPQAREGDCNRFSVPDKQAHTPGIVRFSNSVSPPPLVWKLSLGLSVVSERLNVQARGVWSSSEPAAFYRVGDPGAVRAAPRPARVPLRPGCGGSCVCSLTRGRACPPCARRATWWASSCRLPSLPLPPQDLLHLQRTGACQMPSSPGPRRWSPRGGLLRQHTGALASGL